MIHVRCTAIRLALSVPAVAILLIIMQQTRRLRLWAVDNYSDDISGLTLSSSDVNNSASVCPSDPPNLVGKIDVDLRAPSMSEIEEKNPNVQPGGHGKPLECKARHKVAIIVPYRNRDEHLRTLLNNLHPLLQKQQLDYAIYVVEQTQNETFNTGKLKNVGFTEAAKDTSFDCFIFHDVDMIPENDRNMYSCAEQPRHVSVAVDKFGYKLPYFYIFGGVITFTKDQLRKTNGFSNSFWGWGAEDDEMRSRVFNAKFGPLRPAADIGRYKMIKHKRDKLNEKNDCQIKLLHRTGKRSKTDGLSSLNYTLLDKQKKRLYTWVLVDLHFDVSAQKLKEEGVCD